MVDSRTQQFHGACEAGELDLIDALITHDRAVIDSELDDYFPIQRAIPRHPAVLRRLLEAGESADRSIVSVHWFDWEPQMIARGVADWRLVHMAMIHGYHLNSVECARILHEFGCDFNAVSMLGDRPIHLAATPNYVKTIDFLISIGIDVDSPTGGPDETPDIDWLPVMGERFTDLLISHSHTPLMIAVAEGFPEATRCLLGHGADVNAVNSALMTPLHVVAGALWPERETENVANCRLLLSAGADRRAKDVHGRVPRDIAIARGYQSIAELL